MAVRLFEGRRLIKILFVVLLLVLLFGGGAKMIVAGGAKSLNMADRLLGQGDGARLLIAPGAIGGLDALAAARLGGLERVVHTVIKPPAAWAGSPAEALLDLPRLAEARLFYEGPARAAAAAYPQNANVSATIALAGIGLDRTRVRLIADPAAAGNLHRLEASGRFGTMQVEMAGRPLPDNPKTSAMAALSLARSVLNLEASVAI